MEKRKLLANNALFQARLPPAGNCRGLSGDYLLVLTSWLKVIFRGGGIGGAETEVRLATKS